MRLWCNSVLLDLMAFWFALQVTLKALWNLIWAARECTEFFMLFKLPKINLHRIWICQKWIWASILNMIMICICSWNGRGLNCRWVRLARSCLHRPEMEMGWSVVYVFIRNIEQPQNWALIQCFWSQAVDKYVWNNRSKLTLLAGTHSCKNG